MNRRVVLRNLSLAVAGAGLVRGIDWEDVAAKRSYSIVTDDADFALAQLQKLGRTGGDGHTVSKTRIAPGRQDLAVVESGRLLQPDQLDIREANLMERLRCRTSPGHYLVTAEPASKQAANTVEFRVDGELVERINLNETYRHIEIAGHQGATVFKVADGQVAVRSSSCRKQLCRGCGSVGCGQIVCAPNRLVASISGKPSSYDYDAISG